MRVRTGVKLSGWFAIKFDGGVRRAVRQGGCYDSLTDRCTHRWLWPRDEGEGAGPGREEDGARR